MNLPRYNSSVTRFYGIDEASALLPELADRVGRLADQRNELVRLRDELVERRTAVEAAPRESDRPRRPVRDTDPEIRRIELRMRGLVDQMQADVAWLDDRSIVLRDIPTGLIDFPALVSARGVWLCGRRGEACGDGGQELSGVLGGRRPLIELE